MDAYPLGDDGLGSRGEAEEASVRAPLGDIRVHQVEEVSRIGVELLARDGLSPFLVVFVAAEGGGFVLYGAHGCLLRSCAVWVAVVVLHGHAVWVCSLVGECSRCRGRSSPGYVCWVVWGYRVKPGGEPCLLVGGGGGGGGVVMGGDEV